jgi:hypothetical protein
LEAFARRQHDRASLEAVARACADHAGGPRYDAFYVALTSFFEYAAE